MEHNIERETLTQTAEKNQAGNSAYYRLQKQVAHDGGHHV